MSDSNQEGTQVQRAVAELFSGYRAEWLADEIFQLFTEPSYFPQLVTSHPCFLEGGRGTGKTTALRCLSYEGQLAMSGSVSNVAEWPYYGMYYRVNTNRVNAFQGPELTEERWAQVFAHYINLEFCELVLRFLNWYGRHRPDDARLPAEALQRVAIGLHLGDASTHRELAKALELARIRFEASINNVGDASTVPPLSMQGAPIDQLLRDVKSLPQFSARSFFFLVDEYENFSTTQQRVINTLIKHCGELYSFKVGVREFGFRERSTLQSHEQLKHPADYKLINIADELVGENRFSEFAAAVCNVRLRRAFGDSMAAPDVRTLLPELDPEEEAVLLGVGDAVEQVKRAVAPLLDSTQARWLEARPALEIYSLSCNATAAGMSMASKVAEAIALPSQWRSQYDNYKHSYLFTIKRGKSGIRKYYCGWPVFCLLACGNMRFLLELVDEALTRHLADDKDPTTPIAPQHQTRAAHETGNKNLRELEGLALSGARLTRLLLGLGRIFQVMAEDALGHTPEVNQFHLQAGDAEAEARLQVHELLTEGVMHLALVRYRGNKLQEDSDVRQWDYAIHPIFAPFFGFSHRRKRKMDIADRELLGLVDRPQQAIKTLLSRQNRSSEVEVPEQMQLFSGYYALPSWRAPIHQGSPLGGRASPACSEPVHHWRVRRGAKQSRRPVAPALHRCHGDATLK